MYLFADALLFGCIKDLQLLHFSLKTTELEVQGLHVLPDPVLQGMMLLGLHTLAIVRLQQFKFHCSQKVNSLQLLEL